ncbi:c-type cytochrome [Sandaracinus amylolyticus]|uniref:Cytochrome c551 peroxidase n=1 Tax=Sandaracinus amylolyticus TaxID=927083 RepID=A0A0F6W2N8_9BACT|nr:cytochrome c [Sandaracinus amylolyticus]AKF05943.1 Cytochrome c551 peroxidase [Sandaracinus amylolyticus]
MTRNDWCSIALASAMLTGCFRPPDATPTPDPFTPGPEARSPFIDPRFYEGNVTQEVAPPPISGGTLQLHDGWAIAADADRDRIVVVDYRRARAVHAEVALPPGAEPGRVVTDGAGRAHVVLRGIGEIYSFDPERPRDGERRAVCPMPRGIAHDGARDLLHVACRGGEVVSLPAAGGPSVREMRVEGGDLRDVVVDGDTLLVTRFRNAELLRVSVEGAVMDRVAPSVVTDPFNGFIDSTGVWREAVFQPSVAWRTISMPSGDVAMVHQRASDTELQLAPGAYYATGFCDGSIVQSAVTVFTDHGASRAPNLGTSSLPVDLAVSTDETEIAVVNAGNQSGESAVAIYPLAALETRVEDQGCMFPNETVAGVQNPVAVAYGEGGLLVVQQREPARLVMIERTTGQRFEVDLGGESRFDTGHTIFHANASRGTACASCHPEGGEDGRTWLFAGLGPRRTPAMHGDVTETAPFHWDGDLPDLRALSEVVFTGRMSGPRLSGTQVNALGAWLDELPAPVVTPRDAIAVQRGRELFFGAAECGTCHSGAMLTNNTTVDVGTGGAFQVPSLVGASQRLPVMHDGCATTMRERFDPSCGGDAHGATQRLDDAQIGDLVAYLETL